ncbi:hypothetical protein HDU97_007404 [Phlyctochytrium planicorne]|nr:hypothetical protein HDU97_007404 [Phlyctochytrium planicorne]
MEALSKVPRVLWQFPWVLKNSPPKTPPRSVLESLAHHTFLKSMGIQRASSIMKASGESIGHLEQSAAFKTEACLQALSDRGTAYDEKNLMQFMEPHLARHYAEGHRNLRDANCQGYYNLKEQLRIKVTTVGSLFSLVIPAEVEEEKVEKRNLIQNAKSGGCIIHAHGRITTPVQLEITFGTDVIIQDERTNMPIQLSTSHFITQEQQPLNWLISRL